MSSDQQNNHNPSLDGDGKQKTQGSTDVQLLKKGFSFKPSKIKEQEEQVKQEQERKRIEKERKEQRKREEEERKQKDEEEKKKQPIYFQSYQVKRRAVDFFSSSSASSSSSSRSRSPSSKKDNKKKKTKRASVSPSKNEKQKRDSHGERKERDSKYDSRTEKQKKDKKEMKESEGDSGEDERKQKKKKDKKKKKEKKEKKKKQEKEQKNQLMKINNDELDLYYDVLNEQAKTKRAPEANQKFLYKHVFNRNCLPVSIISFGDKTIPKYMNHGLSGEIPRYNLIRYPMIIGFKRDDECIGLFDDLNKDLGKLTHYSKANREKFIEKNTIRYFDRRFSEKKDEDDGSQEQIQKKIKPNQFEEIVLDGEDFWSFSENKSKPSSLSITFRSEQVPPQNTNLQNLSSLSIKDYSDLKDLKVNVEDLTTEEIKLFQQNKEFNQKIKENPNDPYIWIDYIKLQELGIKYSSTNQFSVQSIMQKKIGIIEKALQNDELGNNQILILYHMRVLQDSNSGEDFYKIMNEKWMEYIQKNIYNMLLWNNFLDYRYSNLLKFSATYFRESTAELLMQLSRLIQSSKQVSEIITLRKIVLLILRKISFIEEQMGFKERSFGMLQALIELNVFCPPHIRRCLDSQKRVEEFKNYWEDFYCGKTGEITGSGWQNQETKKGQSIEQKESDLNKSFIGKYNDHKELLKEMDEDNWIDVEKELNEALWRPANPHFDKDLIKYNSDTIVFSEDVQQYLMVLNDPESQVTLINLLFENLGLPPVNDNIFLSSENKAFSSFYCEKSKNIFELMKNNRISSSKTYSGADYKQYCGIDRLDFLNKFFSFADESIISGGSNSRKKKIIAQLEYVRRLLYELHNKLERESILIYILWIEGIFFIRKAVTSADSILTEKQARINIKNLLKNNEKMVSLWIIYAEILYEKSIQNTNQTTEELNNLYIEIDNIFENVYAANESKSKDKLTVLYFWSSFYLRQVGKADIQWVRTNLLKILQKLNPFTNIKNLILQLHNLIREQIANEKKKLDPKLIPKIKMKVQKVFPLSKKSIYAYFLLLSHCLGDSDMTSNQIVNYQEYLDLIEETNNEKIKIWDDEELYARLQRKFQNEMQLLLLNVLRIQKLTYYISQESTQLTNYDQSKRLEDIKKQQIQLYKTILNKYPFFSVAIVELVLFNIKETTRIDRLVSLKEILTQNHLFYSVWLLIIYNEIALAALTDEENEIILSKLRYYFYEAQKDSCLLDKQIGLLDKFRNQAIGIDATTDYFNQILFLSLFNAFTYQFEPTKLANRSLQALQQAPFSKEAYLYRLQGLEGEQRSKMREVIVEKEIRIIYNDII